MIYRREIDGLRALAVLPVILFHAGFKTFSGGFIGVDIFFVISGYLITSIILAELETGHFSFVRFYERRARRILPALFLVMLACLPFAWLWLLPSDVKNFSQSLIAVSGFYSNIFFYLKSGYFETAAEQLPLLHTWSLAVEEQYYVLFPIFLVVTWRLGKASIVALLVAGSLASLAAAQWGSLIHPTFTFYLLPTRGWELMIGAFAAFYLARKNPGDVGIGRPGLVDQAAAAIGLALIVGATFVFDKQTPFPGLFALVPIVGTALIILFASANTLTGRLLGNRVLVGVGLISYSAYLWHQPLFAFARHRAIEEPSNALYLGLAAAALGLAYLSWRYVERPFRKTGNIDRKTVFRLSVAGSVFFVTMGLIGHLTNGLESIYVDGLTKDQRTIYSYTRYFYMGPYRPEGCHLQPEQNFRSFSSACQDVDSGKRTILVWGDSHSSELAVGLREVQGNIIQYSSSWCAPVVDTVFAGRPHCDEINRFVVRQIERLKPTDVFLHANWFSYKDLKTKANWYSRKNLGVIDSLRKTIEAVHKASPGTTLTIVGGVPQWHPTLPKIMLRMQIAIEGEKFLRSELNETIVVEIDSQLRAIAADAGVRFVSPIEEICRPEGCPVVVQLRGKAELTAFDAEHMTEAGSVLLARRLLEKL